MSLSSLSSQMSLSLSSQTSLSLLSLSHLRCLSLFSLSALNYLSLLSLSSHASRSSLMCLFLFSYLLDSLSFSLSVSCWLSLSFLNDDHSALVQLALSVHTALIDPVCQGAWALPIRWLASCSLHAEPIVQVFLCKPRATWHGVCRTCADGKRDAVHSQWKCCDVMWCDVMSCHVMSCHVMSCHVMSCHVMSCHVMSCHVMCCGVLCCAVMSCCVVCDVVNKKGMSHPWQFKKTMSVIVHKLLLWGFIPITVLINARNISVREKLTNMRI